MVWHPLEGVKFLATFDLWCYASIFHWWANYASAFREMTVFSWTGLDGKLKLVINTFGMAWAPRFGFSPHLKVWMVIWTWLIWSQSRPLNLQHEARNLKNGDSWHLWLCQLPIRPATFQWNVLRLFGTFGSLPGQIVVSLKRVSVGGRYMEIGHWALQSSS